MVKCDTPYLNDRKFSKMYLTDCEYRCDNMTLFFSELKCDGVNTIH